MAREVITEADIERYEPRSEIVVSKGTVITPSALDRAASRGIKVTFRVDDERPVGPTRPLPAAARAAEPPIPVFPPAAARLPATSAGSASGEELSVIVTAVGRNRAGVLAEITTAIARLDG